MRPYLLILTLLGLAFALVVVAGAGRATSDSGTGMFGDVDCDERVGAVDALAILRYAAGLPASQHEGCLAVGSHDQPPVPTATATPQPRGPIAHCWMVVAGYAGMNPGTLGGSAGCNPEPADSPSYDCTIYVSSQAVTCMGTTPWPSHLCLYSVAKEMRCQTYSNAFPDYKCSIDAAAATLKCSVDSSISPVDGPPYECAFTSAEVICGTPNAFYADFACARKDRQFQCHGVLLATREGR